MNLIEKIQTLYDRFVKQRSDAQDISAIDGWMQEAKKLMLLKSLKGHDGVKYVFDIFEGEIKKINELLNQSYSKDLKDIERDRLLDKRNLAQKYVNLFKDIDEDIEKLEEAIDRETI